MVCLGFKPMGCRMVGADETMELWRLPFLGEILSKHSQSDIHRSLEDSGSCLVIVHYNREKVALITFCLSESFQFGMPNISPQATLLSLSLSLGGGSSSPWTNKKQQEQEQALQIEMFFSNMGQSRPPSRLFSSFSYSNDNFKNINWKQCRRVCLGFEPGPQDGKRRRNHEAMVAS